MQTLTPITATIEEDSQNPEWDTFYAKVQDIILSHEVVRDNAYCKWFERGTATREQIRDLTQQFSVFSNYFLVAQLLKAINATNIQQARESKEILANEIGVIFNQGRTALRNKVSTEEIAQEGDPALVSTEGTVDGGTYRFSAAHFEWLVKFAEPLGLTFEQMGKRKFATPETNYFCDELARIYGSEDADIAEGASFAVEHWAAAGFWKQLIKGLDIFRDRECPELRLAFWTWHDKLEDQHAAHTLEELKEAYKREDFDQEKFFQGAQEMLNGVNVFWQGLESSREKLGQTVA